MDKYNDQEKMMEQVRKLALNNPENIRIIETNVDSDIQIEFFETLQKIEITENNIDPKALYAELFLNTVDIERKKEVLAILTVLGEVESFRLLETYLKKTTPELKSWAFLAYQQARLLLESKLLNKDSIIYVASGLGGKDHKLRYIFALFAKENNINETQKNIIKGEIEYSLKKNDGIIENILFKDKFVLCTILVPLYINLVELIQNMTEEINQYGNFLEENIFLTNEKPVTMEDIEKYSINNNE
ncbi:MAG: hypothetical protein LBQ22_05075 [Bacteroidales bacterium]|nr:hypothetical protein [Bacteroidales bacterium]